MNSRAFLQVGRLLIADAPGRNHAVFEVAVLQRHCFLVLGVIGCVEPATPLATVKAPFEPHPNLCAGVAHADLSKQLTLPPKTCISAGRCGREFKLVAIPKDEGEAGGNLREAKAPNTTKQVKIGLMTLTEPVIGDSL